MGHGLGGNMGIVNSLSSLKLHLLMPILISRALIDLFGKKKDLEADPLVIALLALYFIL